MSISNNLAQNDAVALEVAPKHSWFMRALPGVFVFELVRHALARCFEAHERALALAKEQTQLATDIFQPALQSAAVRRKKVTADSFQRGMDIVIGASYIDVDIVVGSPQYVEAAPAKKGLPEAAAKPLVKAARAGSWN